MKLKMWILAGSMGIIAGMAGCETVDRVGPIQGYNYPNPSLVMPTPLMLELARAGGYGDRHSRPRWESGRNDQTVRKSRDLPDYPDYLEVENFQRERLWVSNGRPGENSSYSAQIYGYRSRR